VVSTNPVQVELVKGEKEDDEEEAW
jgi:hypothetical protein